MANYKITQINEETWRIDEEGVRFFLLAGAERALLIDSGMQVHNAKEIAQSLTKLPLSLLNTHADMDHIGSNHEFDVFYMNPAEASNYYHSQKKTGTFIPVEDKDTLDLGGRPLQIISLAGHTPGSIAVLDKKNRVLISGDPIQDGTIFMFGIQRELHAYISSLNKLERYRNEFDVIYPSHGSFPVTPDLIPALRQGAARILDGKAEGRETEIFGRKVKQYDIGPASFLCDVDEA